MCNLSESLIEDAVEDAVEKERLDAIERMIKAKATKEQILLYGYTEDEYEKATGRMFAMA